MKLTGDDGREYLDFLAGIGVCSLGHGDPAVLSALEAQTKKLMHVSNYFYIEQRGQVAALLSKLANDDVDGARVLADAIAAGDETTAAALGAPAAGEQVWETFFANSGAEANEGQIKLARKYAVDHGHPERYVVISMLKSFHGRTLATATATGQEIVHNPKWFSPLPEGFRYAEFNNLESVKEQMGDDVCAILTEPVQGEGGVRPASKEFLQGLRDLCDEKGILLMFDEVQVGSGRTGKLFAHQNYGVEPDTCSMAKALGSGVPIGAVCARGDAAKTLTPGTHGSTFAGGPLACGLAEATLDTMINGGVMENAVKVGEYFRAELRKLQEKHSIITEVRGMGMINGAELANNEIGPQIVNKCFEKKVLINCTAGNVLRFIPPLIATEAEIDVVVKALDEAMTELGV